MLRNDEVYCRSGHGEMMLFCHGRLLRNCCVVATKRGHSVFSSVGLYDAAHPTPPQMHFAKSVASSQACR